MSAGLSASRSSLTRCRQAAGPSPETAAGVFDGARDAAGERLEEPEVVVAERAAADPIHHLQHADRAVIRGERSREHGARHLPRILVDAAVAARVRGRVIDPHRGAVRQRVSGDPLVGGEPQVPEARRRLRIGVRHIGEEQLVGLRIEQHDAGALGAQHAGAFARDDAAQLVEVRARREGAPELVQQVFGALRARVDPAQLRWAARPIRGTLCEVASSYGLSAPSATRARPHTALPADSGPATGPPSSAAPTRRPRHRHNEAGPDPSRGENAAIG